MGSHVAIFLDPLPSLPNSTAIPTPLLPCRHCHLHLNSSSPLSPPLLPPRLLLSSLPFTAVRGHSPLLPPSPPQPPPSLLLPSLAASATSTPPPLPLLHYCHLDFFSPPSPPSSPPPLLPSLSSASTTSTPPSLSLPPPSPPLLPIPLRHHLPPLSLFAIPTPHLPLLHNHYLPSSPPSSPPPPSTLPSSCCLAKDLLFPSLGMNPSSHHWVQASSTRRAGLFSFLFSLEEREAPTLTGRESMGKMGDKGNGDGSPMRWKEREKP